MKIKYSRDVDILLVELDESATIADAVHLDNIIFHLNARGEPVLFEIMQASDFVKALIGAAMQPETYPSSVEQGSS